jgi:hypothetical protein
MNKFMIAVISIFLSYSLFNSSYAALATSGSVYLNAEPGSYVGGGIGASEVTWTHGVEGLFSISRNFDKSVSVNFNDGNYWSFEFAAPTYDPVANTNDGNNLAIGFYDHATRFPFNSPTRPGLNFSGNGRGNNTLGGWFDVIDIAYDQNEDVLRFAVDFRQFDESENMSGPSTYGSLRINSNIAMNPIPSPPSLVLFGSGLLMVVVRKIKKL